MVAVPVPGKCRTGWAPLARITSEDFFPLRSKAESRGNRFSIVASPDTLQELPFAEVLMKGFELIADDDPPTSLPETLEERLYEFNMEATGVGDGRGLSFVCRDEEGELMGGLCGHSWGGCCEIKQVWVAERYRGNGLGRQLLAAAEGEARERGCRQILLTTHSFQAPGLYARLGFEVVATVDDYPVGHQHFLLRKKLLRA
jgi:GNAT superfamily N-acetyltransferase